MLQLSYVTPLHPGLKIVAELRGADPIYTSAEVNQLFGTSDQPVAVSARLRLLLTKQQIAPQRPPVGRLMGKGVNTIFGDCAIRNRDGESITHRIRQNRKRSALPGSDRLFVRMR